MGIARVKVRVDRTVSSYTVSSRSWIVAVGGMAGLHSSNYSRQVTSGEESVEGTTRGSLVMLVIHRQAGRQAESYSQGAILF